MKKIITVNRRDGKPVEKDFVKELTEFLVSDDNYDFLLFDHDINEYEFKNEGFYAHTEVPEGFLTINESRVSESYLEDLAQRLDKIFKGDYELR